MAAAFIVIGVLATTLSQPQMLARIPIQNLLKNELNVSRAQNAAFFFWIGFPWYFKPFAGILTDAYPLFGTRRRGYILLTISLTVLMWVGVYFTPHRYNLLLWACLILDTFMVVASTVVGGYMVEAGQASSSSGRLTAVRNWVEQFSYVIMGPTAGFLAAIAFGWTALACGSIVFLLIPGALFLIREQKIRLNRQELLERTGTQLRNIASAKTMWIAAGLMALFYIAPGIQTALFYKQQNDLHMTTEMQGFNVFLGGIFGIVAATAYGLVCKRYNLRTLLIVCLSLGTLGNLGYVWYSTVTHARVIDSVNGFAYTLCEVALMDLAVRSTPAGSEGLGFSLMMSVRNLALFGTDWAGSKAMEAWHLPFNAMVVANSVTTLITVPLVLALPAVLLTQRDADSITAEPAPHLALQE
ncbi:MAG: MFS transporter [Acidobacteriota bacterium]|nr:MFS transporter [Acidobacteriota bacterium]